MTDTDLDIAQEFQNEYGASRAEVIRTALAALRLISAEERRILFDDIRKNSPKAGRPTVNSVFYYTLFSFDEMQIIALNAATGEYNWKMVSDHLKAIILN